MTANPSQSGSRARESFAGFLQALAAAACFAALAGCQSGTLPDPNDPLDVGLLQPEEVRRNLAATSDFLNWRRARGEINDQQEHELIAKRANDLIRVMDLRRMRNNNAWQYGEIYIAASRWVEARQALEVAVKHPPDFLRRTIDNLRLARVLAEMNEIPRAIAYARSTFECRRDQAAPILPAVLLEIVPAGMGKGRDVELAQLLVDSIAQEKRVLVEPQLEASKAFLIARPHHIQHAYALAIRLLEGAARPDLAEKVRLDYKAWKAELKEQ